MENVEEAKSKIGIISFILGIIGLMVVGVPIIGALVTIAGLTLGVKGHNTNHKKSSTAGIFLCILALFMIVVKGAVSYRSTAITLFNFGEHTSNIIVSDIGNKNVETDKKIIFCQNIDNDLNPTDIRDTFSVDSQFYAKLDNKVPFETSKLKLNIYAINDGYSTLFYTEQLDAEQDASALAIPLNINTAGKYKIVITRLSDNKELGEDEITAVFYN